MIAFDTGILTDPLRFAAWAWPHHRLYDKQAEVMLSVKDDDMTVVPAGNMLGKDFVAGMIIVWFFLSRLPCRIVTTSAKDDHLRVLWGEVKRFIQESKVPLTVDRGGPLIVNHRELKRKLSDGSECPLSYVKGMVASQDTIASMQGHHIANRGDGIPRTLFVSDESSSVPDEFWKMARTWAKRALIFGNPWPCSNFFYHSVKGDPRINDPGGNLFSEDGSRCYRRVIKIKATDSPNIRLALEEQKKGRSPSGRIILDGVKDWEEYQKNLRTWDRVQKCVSLDAEFYEGAEALLFPPEWINAAELYAESLDPRRKKGKRVIGVDPGEGAASSCWSVCDSQGLLELVSLKTPNTTDIPNRTIALMRDWDVRPEDVLFDRGGGGKQHADYLRSKGYPVRTVGFGEPAGDPFTTRRRKTVRERIKIKEHQYTYKNRRAEMYGMVRERLDPITERPFGIPRKYAELRRQMAPIPLQFDAEGRLMLPPKDKKSENSKEMTLKELLGCSPDEADSLALAVYGLERTASKVTIGAYT